VPAGQELAAAAAAAGPQQHPGSFSDFLGRRRGSSSSPSRRESSRSDGASAASAAAAIQAAGAAVRQSGQWAAAQAAHAAGWGVTSELPSELPSELHSAAPSQLSSRRSSLATAGISVLPTRQSSLASTLLLQQHHHHHWGAAPLAPAAGAGAAAAGQGRRSSNGSGPASRDSDDLATLLATSRTLSRAASAAGGGSTSLFEGLRGHADPSAALLQTFPQPQAPKKPSGGDVPLAKEPSTISELLALAGGSGTPQEGSATASRSSSVAGALAGWQSRAQSEAPLGLRLNEEPSTISKLLAAMGSQAGSRRSSAAGDYSTRATSLSSFQQQPQQEEGDAVGQLVAEGEGAAGTRLLAAG
jgi:hypothetical protein